MPEPSETLSLRHKYQRLSYREKLYIFREFKSKRKTKEEILIQTSISPSTFSIIIKTFERDAWNKAEIYCKVGSKLMQSQYIQHLIKKYIESAKGAYTCRDIQLYVKRTSRIHLEQSQIRNYIRENLNMRYKKCKPRPITLDLERQNLLKMIFSIKIIQKMKERKLLINVDEATIGRNTKSEYSWSERGSSRAIWNIKFSKSASIISWIYSNGLSLNAISDRTITSEIFLEFLESLLCFVIRKSSYKSHQIVLILDNWSIHKTNSVKNWAKNNSIDLFYIPPYTPELACVETYFAILKKRVSQYETNRAVDLKGPEGTKLLNNAMRKMTESEVKGIWKILSKEIYKIIDKAENSLFY